MAKTLFGAIVVDARNKLGGHVFSKNRGGSFMRRKVSPSQPRTSPQTLIRAGLTALSKRWGGVLTDAKRKAWTAFAQNNPTKDTFGHAVVLTGEQMYLRCNQPLLFVGAAAIDDPTPNLTVDSVESFTTAPAETGQVFTISAIAPNPLAATVNYVVWVTRQLSPGVSSLATYYRQLTNYQGNQALPFDIAALYTAKYGALEAGKVVGVGIRILDTTTGAISPLFTQRKIVAA